MRFKTLSLFAVLCIAFSTVANAQTSRYHQVGSGTWVTVNATTYAATVTFQNDLTGFGYIPTQIVAGYRLITGTEKVYIVTSATNKTFSAADITIEEYGSTDGAPSGVVMVYNPQGLNTAPTVPFGSTGATAQLGAAIVTYNARYAADFHYTNGLPVAAPSGLAPQTLAQDTSATCRNCIYRWDGAAWVSAGGGGGNTLATNGLTMDGDSVQLGGTLNQNTTITMGLKSFNLSGSGVISNVEPDATQPNKLDYIFRGNNYTTTAHAPSNTGTELQVEAGTSGSKYSKLTISGTNNKTPELNIYTRNASQHKGIFIDSTNVFIQTTDATKYPLASTLPSTAAGDSSIQVVTGNPSTAVWMDINDIGGSASSIALNPAFNQNGAGANETTVQGALESLRIYGLFANDAAAAASSVPVGGVYILSSSNTVGSKIGTLTTRQN